MNISLKFREQFVGPLTIVGEELDQLVAALNARISIAPDGQFRFSTGASSSPAASRSVPAIPTAASLVPAVLVTDGTTIEWSETPTVEGLTTTDTIVARGLSTTLPVTTINTEGDTLAVANNGTATFSLVAGWLMLYDATNGGSGIFVVTNSTVVLLHTQGATTFTATQDNAGTSNVYGSAGTITIQNKLGVSASYRSVVLQLD